MTYKLVLGLEIHLHLKTKTKMFCRCDANIYDAEPNTHTCPTCLGLPGALPVPNFEAVSKEQLLGLALGCELNTDSRFDRKHYSYPDLPKGYQISQYKQPLCLSGSLKLSSGFVAEIERIHLEEDTAKSMHEGSKTLIDFNKSGMPLVEIVTTPCFRNVEDAVEFCKKIQEVVRTLEIGDVDMEKGQMRLEANISLRTQEMEDKNELPPYKVEIKNINSFRFMERAVKAEMVRQEELLTKGERVAQENRGFNEATGKTVSQRSKEQAEDYRYFPEPDIPPMHFEAEHIENLRKQLPELPAQKYEKYLQMGLAQNEADFLSSFTNRHFAQLFTDVVAMGESAKLVASMIVNKPEFRELNAKEFTSKLKSLHDKLTDTSELGKILDKIIENNPAAVNDYKNGKANAAEFIVGQVMRETKGKADANVTRELLKEKLK
ncbi:hypothetical protein A2619_03020 [candidate division WWE3 bacterium RIFOXYD1_FULL_39_9]|uniref:Aspartyl/glutamyl-tRNA(Asn/Gln) amidotransferase subunit B n=1 Tax=candidate division WWE3 bacterium RIFOXYD1_FULL_39_9 TaxID=1802649 RepID=A0A1F4X8N9_UNCKA|nr:MAG: hypothetical protein A2619_03020 [candidate division WWE3 bacterium RIFOXYD1_FULL_39_9]